MNYSQPLCEACHQAPQETQIDDEDYSYGPYWPYRLCLACAHRLTTYSLRPLEWFHLATIHGPGEFFLHDDFYTEDGEARQPDEDVVEPERWPIPALAEAARSLESLVDYAMTRWFLDQEGEVIALLKAYNPFALLAELQRRVQVSPPFEIESCVYCICAYALGHHAETWIRSRWNEYDSTLFVALAHASACCLPLLEGFRRVTEVLETLPARERYQAFPVLAHFQTTLTLDWLETHAQRPVMDTWGRVAAQSQFSWERAVKWLDQGRPLSLVALDALKCCKSQEAAQSTQNLRWPWTFETATHEEMCEVLEAYAARDPAPRVKQAVAALLNS